MKKSVYYLLGLFLAMTVVFSACEDQEVAPPEEALVTLELSGLQPPDQENARTKDGHFVPFCQDGEAVAAVSININGFIYKLVPQWFPGLGKWQVQLPTTLPGVYTVNSLGLLDDEDELIFATPEVGSAFAGLVSKPVPFNFEVKNGEKLINTADVVCYWPSITPQFGIKILEWEKCYVFKNWWFANYCDDYGHVEGDIKGGIYDPQTGKYFPGQFDEEYGFWYTFAKMCENDYRSYVVLYLCITSQKTGDSRYYRIPVPVWYLKYLKYGVTHLLSNCDYNLCRTGGAEAVAADLGITDFSVGDYEGEEISVEDFDAATAAE